MIHPRDATDERPHRPIVARTPSGCLRPDRSGARPPEAGRMVSDTVWPPAPSAGAQPVSFSPITDPTIPRTKTTFANDTGSSPVTIANPTVSTAPMPTQTT